jgi:hypothetical protein
VHGTAPISGVLRKATAIAEIKIFTKTPWHPVQAG